MAQWQSFGHVFPAILALGCIAGMENGRIYEAIRLHDVTPILQAIQ
jgi:hypothetical protein